MVIGHLGVAFEAKGLRKGAQLPSLVAATFLPDIARAVLEPFGNGYTLNLLSHSLPAIGIEALLAATVCRVMGGTLTDAVVLAIVCCTHWPLDVVTGCKATWPKGPVVGFALYQSPLMDFPLEATLVLVGWSALKGRISVSAAASRWVIGGLLSAQLAALAVINAETGFFYAGGITWRWNPAQSLMPRRMPTPWGGCPQPNT